MRQHESDVAALEQWNPLVHKIAHKAARRAAAIGVPIGHDDFVQELRIVVLKCQDSFNPELGVKMITFLHRAMYNEVNKLLGRDQRNVQAGFTISGDTTWSNEDGAGESAWDYVEDDLQRSPQALIEDTDLIGWVHNKISPQASAVLHILQSGHPFVGQQLRAYNDAIAAEALSGGMRRIPLDMNFTFVCKLLGFTNGKMNKLALEIENAVNTYGVE
jgi:DNA-directed RNA polymerase specialized sigma24 family protein